MKHRVLVWPPDRGFLQHYYRHRGDMTTGDSATTTSATILEFNFGFTLKSIGFSEINSVKGTSFGSARTFSLFFFSLLVI